MSGRNLENIRPSDKWVVDDVTGKVLGVQLGSGQAAWIFDPAAVAITGGTIGGTSVAVIAAVGAGSAYNPAAIAPTAPVLAANGSAIAPSYSFAGSPSSGIYNVYDGSVGIARNGTLYQALNFSGPGDISIASTGRFRIGSGAADATADISLSRDAAGVLAQRDSTNAQSFKAANTWTDASNNEYGVFDWKINPSSLTIGAKALGTGTQRNVIFDAASNYAFQLGAVSKIILDANPSIRPNSAGLADLGAAATGWRRLYFDYTNTGVVGPVTINKASGRVNIAAAGSSVVVTNSLCTAAAMVKTNIQTVDATAKSCVVTSAAGSFTITLNAACTGQVAIDFEIGNRD